MTGTTQLIQAQGKDVEMSTEFRHVIMRLASCVEVEVFDLNDEHDRWNIYTRATERAECSLGLSDAIRLEPDSNVALSVVLKMLEVVDAPMRPFWIDLVRAEDVREFAIRRAEDLKILESLSLTRQIRDGFGQMWSSWLQLRVASASREVGVLQWLAESGRTKRIRRAARERLHVVDA